MPLAPVRRLYSRRHHPTSEGEMRAHLVVKHGPYSGLSTGLGEGDVVRFGRSGRADVCLPDDPFLDGVHFAVSCSGGALQAYSLTKDGVLVISGKQTRFSELRDGDWLFAGMTEWSVYVDALEQSSVSDPPRTALDRIAADLKSKTRRLYAVVDASMHPDNLKVLTATGANIESLYQGPSADDLAEVAPYLVSLDLASSQTERLLREFWGKSTIMFLSTSAELGALKAHLRRFTWVLDSSEQQVLFRFYDPRVIRAFLSACNAAETREFFGPIDLVIVEGDVPWIVERYPSDASAGVWPEKQVLRTEDSRVFHLVLERIIEVSRDVSSPSRA